MEVSLCVGFVCFKDKMTMSGIKKVFGQKIHLEIMRGSLSQNEEYCKKEGVLQTFGEIPRQGFRSDLRSAMWMVVQKKTVLDVYFEHPGVMFRYNYAMKDFRMRIEKRQRRAPRTVSVSVLWGPTGTGKTHTASQGDPFIIHGNQLQANNGQGWWDGYAGERTLLIDEYHNDVPIGVLQGLLDKYWLRLPIKGSFTYANWDTVFITTNLSRDEWHPKASDASREALFRRVHHWIHLDVPFVNQLQ